MPDPLFEEYKAYYQVRAQKYAGNPCYENSYRAEKNLSDLVQSCEDGQAFKERLGNLNELCANALIKDECLMEQAHFEKHQETIRKGAAKDILQKVDDYTQVMDLITMVNETYQKNNIAVSMDEAQRQLIHDWDLLDIASIYAQAEVPGPYQAAMQSSAAETRAALKENADRITANMQHWQAGWRLDPQIILEYRHRRLLPFSEEQIREQLKKYLAIINP